MLCRHYLYYIQSKNENDVFETMISLFGQSPEDGCIYCKKCGEFLCPEEESTFSIIIKPLDGNSVASVKSIEVAESVIAPFKVVESCKVAIAKPPTEAFTF